MASFVLSARNDIFPVGTSVGAYPQSAVLKASGPPPGAATDTQTMTATGLTFTGLVEGGLYWAVGQVGSDYRWLGFTANEISATDSTAVTRAELADRTHFDPADYGADGDGENDDIGALRDTAEAASAVGGLLRLDAASYGISELFEIPETVGVVGPGSPVSKIKALAPAAGVRYGGVVGGAATRHGPSGGWAFEGNGLSTAGVSLNTVNVVYTDLVVTGVDGDSIYVLGQNNQFNRVGSGDCSGDCFVLDNGAGGNAFFIPQGISSDGYHFTFKRSATPSVEYDIPTLNYFYGAIGEQGGSLTFGGTCPDSIHHTEGSSNYFYNPNLFVPVDASPVVFMEPGAGGHTNGRLYLINATLTGSGGTSTAAGIEANAVSGGVAGGFAGDIAVVLEGDTIFSGLAYGINWGTSTPIYQLGQSTLYSVGSLYTTTGSGAFGAAEGRPFSPGRPGENFPDDISVTQDAYIGRRLNLTRTDGDGFMIAAEQSATPSAPAANQVHMFARDNGSGKTQWCARFSTGAVQVIATEP